MSILDKIKAMKPEKQFNKEIQEAQSIFNKQCEQLKAIKDSSGFNEIVTYWERVQESADKFLTNSTDKTDPKDLSQARMQRRLAIEFLGFLTSRLK